MVTLLKIPKNMLSRYFGYYLYMTTNFVNGIDFDHFANISRTKHSKTNSRSENDRIKRSLFVADIFHSRRFAISNKILILIVSHKMFR